MLRYSISSWSIQQCTLPQYFVSIPFTFHCVLNKMTYAEYHVVRE